MASPLLSVSLDDVRAAQDLLSGVVRPTPLEYSRALSDRVGTEVFLKCENLQRAGSFKIRGAYTRMSRLSDEEKARGVVAASAGNHAQGVALAGQLLGIDVKVYMPHGAPMPKLIATQAYGATIEQVGTTIDECLVKAREWEAQTGAVLIHPFDHRDIVAGPGHRGPRDPRPVPRRAGPSSSAPVAAACSPGISVAVKALRPDVRVIGVQAEQAAAYPLSLAAGKPVPFENMQTMADGIAVGMPGDVPFELVRDLCDGMETVSEEELSRALLFVLERAKLVVEPAGAAAVAHLLDRAGQHVDGPVVAVLSGGNIDPLLLLRIIRHGMAAAGRYLQFRVRVSDRPGHLARLLADCAAVDANVLEVEHIRTGTTITVDEVEIGLQLETRGQSHCEEVLRTLRGKGYPLKFG